VTKIIILVFLVFGVWLSLRSLERRSLYFPDRIMIANPSVYRLPYEDFQVSTQDGVKVCGWFIPASAKASAGGPLTILFSHGNAGNISNRLDKIARLRQTGANLVFYDYRGYGESEGAPSEIGTYQDAEAVYRYVTQTKHIAPERVVFYGESLGCAVAVEMAIRHPDAAGLILESAFTSTVAMARRVFPRLPVKWIVRYHYDNLSKIPRIKMPLLIMHSPQDEIVPFEMGRQLYAAAPQPKTFFELTGGHNDGYAETGDRYIDAIHKFLRDNL
jgi:fermentation-respiration switch protein FrsA (DUF1100 family)